MKGPYAPPVRPKSWVSRREAEDARREDPREETKARRLRTEDYDFGPLQTDVG